MRKSSHRLKEAPYHRPNNNNGKEEGIQLKYTIATNSTLSRRIGKERILLTIIQQIKVSISISLIAFLEGLAPGILIKLKLKKYPSFTTFLYPDYQVKEDSLPIISLHQCKVFLKLHFSKWITHQNNGLLFFNKKFPQKKSSTIQN